MITKTINLYTFDELTDDAKERARQWWRDCENQDFGGHGELNEPIETAARILGITLKTHDVPLMSGKSRQETCVWWTLHTQGAGASFDGTYSYATGSSKAIRAEFPQDKVLHEIADGLAEIQKRYAYKVTALIKADSRGHFLDVEFGLDSVTPKDITCADDEAMREFLRDFARWIYKYIDAEYSYRMEDENVDDAMRANEYTFTANGKRED